MVCVRVAFHENDGNHENDENDEDNSDGYKQGAERWIRGNHHGNHERKPRESRVQTTGAPNHGFRNNQLMQRQSHASLPHSGTLRRLRSWH